MTSESVKAFKNELRNYNYNLSRVVKFSNLIEDCFDKLGGVHAIDTTKEPIHSQRNIELEYKIRDQIEIYERNKARYQTKIDEVDEILAKIETSLQQAIKDVFIEGRHMRNVASKMYISHSTLQRRIDAAIKRALM